MASVQMKAPIFNVHGVSAIYRFEMARFTRTIWQSLVTPVITTSLYFVVFGSAIGSRMQDVHGVPYAAFIVPGLIMLLLLTEGISNASFGIYLPKWSGTIYEVLSAPVSAVVERPAQPNAPVIASIPENTSSVRSVAAGKASPSRKLAVV